jgi:hypothetical protein
MLCTRHSRSRFLDLTIVNVPVAIKEIVLVAQVEQISEKAVHFVIPSEARNLSSIETREKRDSSARSVPQDDNNFSLSQAVKIALLRELAVQPGLPANIFLALIIQKSCQDEKKV